MYYSNQDYMQDLNFYNQVNPNMQNIGNPNGYSFGMQPNTNCMCSQFQNGFIPNNMQCNMNQTMQLNNNLEGMYPCTYKIINPVVERVIDGTCSRNQMVTEDNLNNMVDTVFNIVEGQIEKEDSSFTSNSNNTSSDTRNSNINSTMQNRNSSSTSERNDSSNFQRDRSNSLIKDIIRILIIRSLLSRNMRNSTFSGFQNTSSMMRQMPNFF